jgi:hypothetical protein
MVTAQSAISPTKPNALEEIKNGTVLHGGANYQYDENWQTASESFAGATRIRLRLGNVFSLREAMREP